MRSNGIAQNNLERGTNLKQQLWRLLLRCKKVLGKLWQKFDSLVHF
jgi:hypothetical protein